MPILDEHKQLISDLWLDQPNAHSEIDRKKKRGDLTATESENLHLFTDQGYMVFSLSDPESVYRTFDAEIDRLWRDKPLDLSVARGKTKRMSFADIEDGDRKIGYRVKDPHSHSNVIEHFYLHPEIFRYVELVLGQKAVAFQSIYFEYGSQQGLHRDPMFVVTNPPSHLVASWIALDDITEECGPLNYIPGSHRLPWYEFGPDKVTAQGPNVTPAHRKAYRDSMDRLCAERNLSERRLVIPRGDVLIWHGNLLHGGTPVMNEKATRKSFVVHYSTYGNYEKRRGTMKMNSLIDGEVDTVRVGGTTTNIVEKEGCAGLDNPLLYMKKESSGKQALKRIGKKLLGH